jgi:anti-anti-sigma factor
VKLSTDAVFGTPLIRIEGDVEPDDAPILERAAWDAFGLRGIQIVLDLESCTHFSSTGLAVVFSLVRWVHSKGGKVIAIRPSTQILRLLQIVRLTDEHGFHLFPDLESARETVLSSARPCAS